MKYKNPPLVRRLYPIRTIVVLTMAIGAIGFTFYSKSDGSETAIQEIISTLGSVYIFLLAITFVFAPLDFYYCKKVITTILEKTSYILAMPSDVVYVLKGTMDGFDIYPHDDHQKSRFKKLFLLALGFLLRILSPILFGAFVILGALYVYSI